MLIIFLTQNFWSFAADRYSVATGIWSSVSTWSTTSGGLPGATPPGVSDNAIIEGGVIVTLDGNKSVANVTVKNGSVLDAAVYTLSVSSVFTLDDGSTFKQGGTVNSVPGSIKSLASTSTYIFNGAQNGLSGTFPVYGNLTFQSTPTAAGTFAGNLNVAGNMIINLGASYEIRFATGSTGRNHTISGNLTTQGSSIVVGSNGNNNAGSATITIGGNLSVNSGTFRGTNDAGNATFNIAGNLINDGIWQQDDGSSTGVFTINLNGQGVSQDVNGSNAVSFENFNIYNSTCVYFKRNINVDGTLTIASGNILNICAGTQLSVTGTTTTNGGLTLKSLATTGPAGSFLPTGTVTGSVTVERYIPAWTGNSDGWYFLSSPVSGQAISPNFIDISTPGNYDFYSWDETQTSQPWINFKGSSFTTFTAGESYLVAYAAANTKSFSGSLNQSDIAQTNQSYSAASGYAGWHLLGNPYSCALHWNDGNWGLSNIEAVAQIMNSGGTYTARMANDPIPAMNGFMVHATSGTNSLIIPLAARFHSSSDWLKSTAGQQDKLMLTASSNDNTTYVETIIQFDQEATPAFDMAFDGHFLRGVEAAPRMYSIIGDNEHLCINTLPQNEQTRSVPVAFEKGCSSNYNMTSSGIESFNPDVTIFLEDLKAGKSQDLRQNPAYGFTSLEGDDINRFILHFGGPFSVNDLSMENPFNIYSANKTIYISNKTGVNLSGDFFVYNMVGQVVANQKMTGEKLAKVSMNGNATGYYVVKVVTNENTGSGKVFL
ncbi:MAG: hypothetical protein WCO93_02990 [bacterium]